MWVTPFSGNIIPVFRKVTIYDSAALKKWAACTY